MTDNEIVKAFEWIIKCNDRQIASCEGCLLEKAYPYCDEEFEVRCIDLIKRQREEIERLSDRNHKCIYLSDDETTEFCVDGPCPKFKTEKQIRAEAIKEFAERLQDTKFKHGNDYIIYAENIDNFVKEMTEENSND